jgi:hypothetical protein
MPKIKYKVIEVKKTSSWRIVNEDTGALLNDQEYKSKQAACRAAKRLFSDAEQARISTFKKAAVKFWKNNPKFAEDIFYIELSGLEDGKSDKEIENSILAAAKKRGIEGLKREFLYFLP